MKKNNGNWTEFIEHYYRQHFLFCRTCLSFHRVSIRMHFILHNNKHLFHEIRENNQIGKRWIWNQTQLEYFQSLIHLAVCTCRKWSVCIYSVHSTIKSNPMFMSRDNMFSTLWLFRLVSNVCLWLSNRAHFRSISSEI